MVGKTKEMDFSVINQAFGDYADLYTDVLRVSVAASPEQIQLAYFDRRSELFSLLAKFDAGDGGEAALRERAVAELKMDAIVLAVRILGDAEQRVTYDNTMRQERQRQKRLLQESTENAQRPSRSSRARAKSADIIADLQKSSPASLKSSPKYKADQLKPSPKGVNETHDTDPSTDEEEETIDDTYATDTYATETDASSAYIVPKRRSSSKTAKSNKLATYDKLNPNKNNMLTAFSNSRIVKNISDEVSGTCSDTLMSFDQVFNAFTLSDKDIKAVTKRIEKAKRQLDS